ncbi:4'-phosphopantetheinyl transferase superfamily protein [Flavobacterium sp. SUN052]|uniref:4'-phosphopantetheinyl transferase family protein n=1 Tax=Flavobacterium sp. SUN052 TaxID=3002441 RepID=UPI00237E4F19|nr:4'-phosphopantetheinyl transferase superfamily protein [Flavobacterium sp. SUN052]MEC4003268.1 4'-phosphopantetheinyl transferase superfamily protein [Flavobacterium sp. SUN052]
MPLHKVILLSKTAKLYLWKITEDLDVLKSQIRLKDSSIERLNSMKSESHQKGFLAVRMLLQHNDYNDFDLYYDDFGKPHIKPQGCSIKDVEISISHSNDFSAIVISDEKVGLDLEQLKDKTLKIAPRFMDVSHLNNLSEEEKIKKATVVWGIKESIFKIKNEKGISFPDHIFEDNFTFDDKKATATLKFNNKEEKFKIQFDSVEDYIFVCAFQSINN